MLLALQLSARRGLIPADEVAGLRALLLASGLPVDPPADMAPGVFLELMARDKKVVNGRLRLVLLEAIGKACIVDDALERELVELLESRSPGA
jgi:3-dehydroquinate synthase